MSMPASDPVALAQSLIRFPSVTPEDHGCQAYLAGVLEQMGFKVTHLRFEGGGSEPVHNFYARLGDAGPHLCYAGHTDVVPVGDEKAWSVPPFEAAVKDGYLYGRGAEDMKGAIACFVSAVQRYLTEHGAPKGSISLLITGDEEGVAVNGTKKVVDWLRERGETPDACIVGEPTNPTYIGEMVKIGRRGSMNMVLTVQGKQGHVAYPHLADNPITPLIRILHALKEKPIDEGTEHFIPSNLEMTSVDVGNPVKNVIPAEATARINVRFNSLHTAESVIAWVKSVIERFVPVENYTLTNPTAWGAFITPPGHLSQLMVDSIAAVTGHTPQLSTTGGTSDARFIRDICPVVEFGSTGFTPHMVDERVKTDDLHILTACYFEIVKRYFK